MLLRSVQTLGVCVDGAVILLLILLDLVQCISLLPLLLIHEKLMSQCEYQSICGSRKGLCPKEEQGPLTLASLGLRGF